MPKGDHKRMQNQVDYQGGLAQNHLNNLRSDLTRQNQGMENRFNVAADRGNQDYLNLMNLGGSMLGNIMGGPSQGFGAYGGYQNFANTGGYSDQDISNIRARSTAPMRATYANAMADVDRQKKLQGGYAPNAIAAKAKMARELSYGLADASTNAEAAIADSIRQGKLSGLGGMTNIDNALLNNETQRLGLGNSMFGQLGNLYGTAPGMAQMYGNQMLNSSGQQLQTAGLQNDIMRAILGGQNQVSNTQGNFQSAMSNINSGLQVGSNLAKLFSGFGGANPANAGGK